jgi:uncharacterized Ntn-hydrolase superfamily protein
MTWSIVARGPAGEFGVVVASRFFAVGMLCAHARSGVGALATQALVNPGYGPSGLDLLSKGLSPEKAIQTLTAADEGRDHRQVHLIDSQGRIAAHTGNKCIEWCGHLAGEGYSVAGNMLTGPEVLQSTSEKFKSASHLPFAERLMEALHAGEQAGGDKRGKQAAALRIHSTEDYPLLDIRLDDHEDPIVELKRLYRISLERFQPFATCLPSKARPAGITDRALIEAEVARFQTRMRSKEDS